MNCQTKLGGAFLRKKQADLYRSQIFACVEWHCFQRLAGASNRDSLDWKGIEADQITERVMKNVVPGSIILFHNAAKHTPEALPGIIEQLLAQGYKIVPVSQLILTGEYKIDNAGMQYLP